jgi:hypothetical protein
MHVADQTKPQKPIELAKRYGCKVGKIHAFIRAGLLRAVDISLPGSERPRWRILPADIEAFERARSSRPAAKATPKRRPKADDARPSYF